jgi:UDP-N-acetylmuramate dehydrogenase
VGGALAGNAGYGGGQIGDLVESVTVLGRGGACEKLSAAEIGFGYRSSGLTGRGVILEGTLRLRPGEREAIGREMHRLAALRRSRQPVGAPSAGCIFKNPPGDAAGRLLDAAGMRGASEGGARISERHANFIVNRGGARAADVKRLIARAARRVEEKFGITLSLEIEILGNAP